MSCVVDGTSAEIVEWSGSAPRLVVAHECDWLARSIAAALCDTVTYAPPTSSSFSPGGTEGVDELAVITGNSSRLSSSSFSLILSARNFGVLIN